MANFEKEFHQRLRRVCGVTDDTKRVGYEIEGDKVYDFDTFDSEAHHYETFVSVWCDGAGEFRTFSDLGALMRELDSVKL